MPEEHTGVAQLARFETPADLLHAVRACRQKQWLAFAIYTPFPVEEIQSSMHYAPTRVPWAAFWTGVVLALSLLVMQWYSAAIDYPYIVAGRPFFSLPAFAVITGVMAMLGGVLGSFVAMLVGNRLPQPYHQVFNADDFGCDTESFWLMLYSGAADIDAQAARDCLAECGATTTQEVEA